VASYSEGAPGVADVRLPRDGQQFVIVALRPGVTSLLLIYSDGRQVRYSITVLDPQQSVTATGGVPVRENIRLDLYFVQLQENYSHQIGIAFPGSIGGQGIARVQMSLDLTSFTLQSATATITNQALPRLDIAQASGWARLLRQAMLVTANGQEAEINSGGEVNIVVSGGFGGQIQRIEFGSIIEVTPRYDPQTRRIELAIQADVSDLTAAGVSGVPGRTRTTLSTVVNLELGQSIVLGGLVSRSSRESQGGLPGLSQIPIVGVLFGSNQRADENVENLLFIVPTVVQAVPRAQSDRIAEALRIYERYGSIGGPGLGDIELIEPSPPGYE
jgi:pilus assembly protein CpaC